MAKGQLILLVTLSLISLSIEDATSNTIDTQEDSPLADVAKEILKEKNLENIGGMVNTFIQSGGAKQLMDGVLQNLASNGNSGQLLESLGSLLNTDSDSDKKEGKQRGASANSGKKQKDEINPIDLLSGIGSLIGAMQGAGAEGGQVNPTAALLQGLSSMFGGANNNNEGGGNNAGAALLQGLGSLLGSATQENARKQGGKDNNNAGALLQGLSSVLGAAAAGNQADGNGAGALLQGLGSLLNGGQEGGEGKLNPEIIGNMISMFANAQNEEKKPAKPSKSKPPKKATSSKPKAKKVEKPQSKDGSKTNGVDGIPSLATSFLSKKGEGGKGSIDPELIFENFPLIVKMGKAFGGPQLKQYFDPIDDIISLYNDFTDKGKTIKIEDALPRILNVHEAYQRLIVPYLKSRPKAESPDEEFDFSSLINVASTFFNQATSTNAKGTPKFMEYVPMIMNTISSFTGQEAQARADSHSGHSWALPPVLERIHIYFDNFMSSDMGKQLLSFLENQKAFKVFKDETGNFSYQKFQELIENHSFRRHFIQQVTNKLVDFLKLVSDEDVQSEYVDLGVIFANSVLVNAGFPKAALLDFKRPVKSITSFSNFAAKKYLGAELDTKEYVEPAVQYTQEVLKMAKASINPGSQSKELTDKLTDTINMEIIEPITRVNRAYRFAKSEPNCDRYIFCVINQEESPNDPGSLPGLRKVLYKGSSLIAGWFLSSHTGTSYWDLYAAVTESKNCQVFHNDLCNGFYQEEIKATTEYIHNEL